MFIENHSIHGEMPKVSMIRIYMYHIHTLTTSLQYLETEPQNTNSHKTSQEDNYSKTTSSLFLVKMIAKLEKKTQRNA